MHFFHALQFGFSLPGLLAVLPPLIPNIAWAVIPSHYRTEAKQHCGQIWEGLETVFRIFFIAAFLLFAGDHFRSLWLPLIASAFLLPYYWRWIRYFCGKCNPELLWRPMLGLPAPMAVLPTLYFLLMSAWFKSILIFCIVLIFGICHIRNALSLRR